jgi:hypothetical protein
MGVIAAGSGTAATSVTSGAFSDVSVSGGFSRSILPQAIGSLRSSMNYTVNGASVASVSDGGISVTAPASSVTTLHVNANAPSTASHLVWMQNASLTGSANPGRLTLDIAATGNGGDAEVGIIHASANSSGTGTVETRARVIADATGGGKATTYLGEVNIMSSTSGTSQSSVYMGSGWPNSSGGDPAGGNLVPGVHSFATGSGSVSTIAVAGDFLVTANGGDAYAYLSGLVAEGTNGGAASIDIGGSLVLSSTAAFAQSILYMEAKGTGGGTGSIHVHGDVNLNAHATATSAESAKSLAGIRATGDAVVDIDGALRLTAGDNGLSQFQIVSQGNGHVEIGDIYLSNTGQHAWIDIVNFVPGGMKFGDLNVELLGHSDVRLHLQDAAGPVTANGLYMLHTNPHMNAAIDMGDLNISGDGTAWLYLLTSMDADTIRLAPTLSDVHFLYGAWEGTWAVNTAISDVVEGFQGHRDSVLINGVAPTASNFESVGSFTSASAMYSAMEAALNGTQQYVFATYNGTEDVNRNGVADDTGDGVLAFDGDGSGVSMVMYMQGVTTMTHTDLL